MLMLRWALVSDSQLARLIRIGRTEHGRARVEVESEIENSWEAHQHGRPMALGERPMAPGERGGHSYASDPHERETRLARFAKEVGVWVEEQAAHHGIDRVDVFSPPEFLGALRDSWSPAFGMRVREHPLGLTGLSASELAEHQAITGLLA